MSKSSVPLWVVAMLDKRLSPVELRVLLNLIWHQGGNSAAWPSQSTIGREVGLTTEAVRKITKRLEEIGWLTVTWAGPGRGEKHQKTYAITRPENPNGGLGLATRKPQQPYQENPNGCTTKTPTAKPRHIRRTHSRTQSRTQGARETILFPPSFEDFWNEYPRQIDKLGAFREWQTIDPDETLSEKIIVAVRAWKRSDQWTRDGGKFIVYPVRFLRERRFDDELPCSPEPKRGDPDWLPSDEELDAIFANIASRKEGAE